MGELQAVDDQLAFLRDLLGEPSSADDSRFTPAQLVRALNEGRRWFCENSHSFQIKDSQETNPAGVPTKLYATPFDIIDFYNIEWDGLPLDLVRPQHWRDKIGDDDDIQGDPYAVMYFTRQLQLFYVPRTAKTLRYHGYGYSTTLVAGGQDTQFTDQQARAGLYRASWKLKAIDERDVAEDKGEAIRLAEEFLQQYKPKGPRYVRTRR